MNFLADMGISRRTVLWLRQRGHNAVHLRELGLKKLPDYEILVRALGEGRIVLTMDLDFGYLLAISHAQLPSVIIFRLNNEHPDNVNRRLEQVLRESSEALMQGAIITVTESAHRVRFLPIQ
jgi:predicted nuclease of predicted toxin-antitoxin system